MEWRALPLRSTAFRAGLIGLIMLPSANNADSVSEFPE